MSAAADESRPASGALPVLVLVAVAGACWAVTAERMQGMDMGPGTDLGGLGWFFVVWVTMMSAMMLPSLSPMAVSYTRAAAGRRGRSIGGTVAFGGGYLLPWAVFGLLAYVPVELVRSVGPGVMAWDRAGRYVAGGVILGAALYELTKPKQACLRHCRDSRLLRQRSGGSGALVMGIAQGGFCVGCSGALMAALFALGVMSIAWMLVIAALIAIEKLLPWRLIATGMTAALLALLGVSIMFVPDHVPWLTVPTSM